MTVDAPAHRKAGVLIHFFHRLHRAVTLVAGLRGAKLRDVRGMVELHEVRQHVDLFPNDGLIIVVSLRDLLDRRLVGRHHQMAVHANVQAGDSRVLGALC